MTNIHFFLLVVLAKFDQLCSEVKLALLALNSQCSIMLHFMDI